MALTGVETVISFDSDDVHVAVGESDGGGLVEAGLPNSITNLSLGCIQYVHTCMINQQ